MHRLHQPFGALLYSCYQWKHFSFIHIINRDKHRPNKKLLNYNQGHFVAIAYIALLFQVIPFLYGDFISRTKGKPPTHRNQELHAEWQSMASKTSDQTGMCMCVDKPVENALVKIKFRVT